MRGPPGRRSVAVRVFHQDADEPLDVQELRERFRFRLRDGKRAELRRGLALPSLTERALPTRSGTEATIASPRRERLGTGLAARSPGHGFNRHASRVTRRLGAA